MSNIFKSNSRFAILTQDIPNVEHNNVATNRSNSNSNNNRSNSNSNNNRSNSNNNRSNSNNNRSNSNNNRSNSNNNRSNNAFKNGYYNNEKEKVIKPKEELNILSYEMFPTLGDITIKNKDPIMNNDNNYFNILKKEKIIKKIETVDFVIKPGFVKLKLNRKSRKIETITNNNDEEINDYERIQKEGFDVLNGLVKLHERRTKEYIDTWGYDTWEKLFIFPNYDYNYFDKLDELYDDKMDEEYQKELNNLHEQYGDYEDYNYE
jgi:hypothetical protein